MRMNNVEKRYKKKRFSALKIFGVMIVVVPILFLTVGMILMTISHAGEIRERPLMYGQHVLMLANRTLGSQNNPRYFSSMEEAIAAHWREGVLATEDEVIRFEAEGERMIFFAAEDWRAISFIAVCFFQVDERGVSFPLYGWRQVMHGADPTYHSAIFFDEDRIVRDIIMSYRAEHVTARVNDGVPIYYGIGVGAMPVHMSILGYEPDAMFPFTFRGQEYFFWYYLSTPQFGEVISENLDLSVVFTFGEVIPLFDIVVER